MRATQEHTFSRVSCVQAVNRSRDNHQTGKRDQIQPSVTLFTDSSTAYSPTHEFEDTTWFHATLWVEGHWARVRNKLKSLNSHLNFRQEQRMESTYTPPLPKSTLTASNYSSGDKRPCFSPSIRRSAFSSSDSEQPMFVVRTTFNYDLACSS